MHESGIRPSQEQHNGRPMGSDSIKDMVKNQQLASSQTANNDVPKDFGISLLSHLMTTKPNKKSIHDVVIDDRTIDRKLLEITVLL